MKKYITIFTLIFILITFFSCGPKIPGEAPEAIFNKANDAMVKGEYSTAIELYYQLLSNYKDFKKYRDDILYRLGLLLYKTERYDEAEKVLTNLINKYKNYKKIKNAYIMLLYIYLQEFKDEAKANKIKELYEKNYGADDFIQNMNKTLVLLKIGSQDSLNLLKLSEKDIVIINEKKVENFDREFFPVLNYEDKIKESNSKKMVVERKKTKEGYYLFLKNKATGETKKINGSKNGYAPQWAWDDRYILFTSMDWDNEERKIKIYDIKNDKSFLIFKGKNIEPILCFSPDSSKIVFGYMNKFWIINKTGANISLLHKDIKAKDIVLMAWARDCDKILYKKNKEKFYHILQLGKREIELFK
jgi:outer membrane protein assembly factor BamD (BamD/ComL family)